MVSSGSPSSREKNVGNSVTNGTLLSLWYIGSFISEGVRGHWGGEAQITKKEVDALLFMVAKCYC